MLHLGQSISRWGQRALWLGLLFNWIVACLSAPLLSGASDSGSVAFSIQHLYDGERLVLNSLRYRSADSTRFSISRLSYLLSGVAFQRVDGSWLAINGSAAWIDLERRRESLVLPDVPLGEYRAIRFHLGVDEERNHGDPAVWSADHALNPQLNGLHWDWKTGYIFAAVEGAFRGEDLNSGFVFHLANDWNLREIILPIDFELRDSIEVHLAFDLGHWFSSPQPISFTDDGASTHSRKGDVLAQKLWANLESAFSVEHILAGQPIARPSKVEAIDFPAVATPYQFKMSARFPMPPLPVDNPLIEERVNLGEKLFFDQQLSSDNTISCASCHLPEYGFSDPRRQSVGVGGALSRRHSMPLFNLAWKEQFFWDGRMRSLREQVLHPIQHPREMNQSLEHLIAKLEADPGYRSAFKKAFASGAITDESISLSLESYLLTLTSYDSRFDRTLGGIDEMTDEETRGFELFMTEFEPRSGSFGADCFHCHGGPLMTNNRMHNNGLPINFGDRGQELVTGVFTDRGKFSTPSLRNIAETAPYMHDGRFQSLEEVVAHYSEGIERSPSLDPNLAKHPRGGLRLSPEDQKALVAFLRTLSDPKMSQSRDSLEER